MIERSFMTRMTCDRVGCGNTEVFTDDEYNTQHHNWGSIEGKNLCPSCTQEYRKTMYTFWGYGYEIEGKELEGNG